MSVATHTSASLSYDDLAQENVLLRRQLKEALEDKSYFEEMLRLLQNKRYAPTSEVAKEATPLFNEAEETIAAAVGSDKAAPQDNPAKPKRNRGKPKRTPLPGHLPRIDRLIDLSDKEKVCGVSGTAFIRIGEEVSERLGIKPAEVYVIRVIRPKYVCPCAHCTTKDDAPAMAEEFDDEPDEESAVATGQVPAEPAQQETALAATPTVKIAPLPPEPIPKSFATSDLLAYIATSKYEDALPLYRQETIFERIGVELSRSTLAGWMVRCGEIVKPLINLAKDELITGPVILCDETRVQVLKGTGKKPTAKSYMWCFMSGRDDPKKIILFELGPSRSHEVPLKFLEDYVGYLHTDGYEAYETLAALKPGIVLVGDWVHVRRKFDEAIKALPKDFKGEILIKPGFDMINELFRIEREVVSKAKNLSERQTIRDEMSKPIIDKLKAWADDLTLKIRPKSLSNVALRYMLDRWDKLVLFLKDSKLHLDTNPVENAIRPFVMGRKNWLFSDSLAGAEASAALYSLISMAKAHGLIPYEYLKTIFTELPKARTLDDVEALLPWRIRRESS